METDYMRLEYWILVCWVGVFLLLLFPAETLNYTFTSRFWARAVGCFPLEHYCGQYAHLPLVICSLFSAAMKTAFCFPVWQYRDCSFTGLVTCAELTNKSESSGSEKPLFPLQNKASCSTYFPVSFSSMIKKELQRLSNLALSGLCNSRSVNSKARWGGYFKFFFLVRVVNFEH